MEFVKVFDNERKVVVKVFLDENNKIEHNYFRETFANATGLFVREEDGIASIPSDENNNFTWNWDTDVVYDLIYSDPSKERILPPPPPPPSPPPTSTTTRNKFWSWIEIVGGLFSSTNVPDQYKKMN